MPGDSSPRFGARNLLALLALAGWSWWIASRGLDLRLPEVDLGSLARGLPAQAAWFLPVGVLIPLVLPRIRSFFGRLFFVLMPSLVIGAGLSAAIVAAPPDAPLSVLSGFTVPGSFALFVPLVGMATGALLGSLLAGSLGAALLLIPAFVALAAVLLAIAAVILLLLTDRIPIAEPINQQPGSGSLLRDLRDGEPFEAGRLAAIPPLLVEAGLDPGFRLGLGPAEEGVMARVSLPWEIPFLGVRYLNAEVQAAPSLEGGALRAGLREVTVGGLRLPLPLVRAGSRAGSAWASQSLLASPALRAAADPQEAAATSRRLLPVLEALRRKVPEIHARPDRLAGALAAAFEVSRQDSGSGDPVEENRLALLALGGAVGHPSLLMLAGFPDCLPLASELGDELEITIFGRTDWARHFLLSAGLTQIGRDGIPEQAGAIKERLDASAGSGFSFSDLLMDSAGARFGRNATRSLESARRIQSRLGNGVADTELVPEVSGLPEGLSRARVEEEFGGFSGEGFREVEAEIERRLSRLAFYE